MVYCPMCGRDAGCRCWDPNYATSFGAVQKSSYDRQLEAALVRAKRAGVTSFSDPKSAERHGAEAAECINSRGRVGYTVYGSEQSTPDGRYLAMVGYGSGTTPSQARRYMQILKECGWAVSGAVEGGGFYVSSNTMSRSMAAGRDPRLKGITY